MPTRKWRAMLDAALKFHTYSLNNQLLIELEAARLGFSPIRVAGFGTWKMLGRSVVKRSTGLAVLAPCSYGALPPDLGHAWGVYAAVGSVVGTRRAS